MGIEIERKFLVVNDSWRTGEPGVLYLQGYLCHTAKSNVRVRITGQQEAWLTIKGHLDARTRLEYEYPIPPQDAIEMLERLCGQHVIEKLRYRVSYAGLVWEVDEFRNNNADLLIAEVELSTSDQDVMLPPWVGTEVTEDRRYYNAYLAEHPYSQWQTTAGLPV